MKTATSMALFSVTAVIATTSMDPSSCSFPGALVCNTKNQLGICDQNKQAVWVDVAKGTKCVCAGTFCSVISADTDAHHPNPIAAQALAAQSTSISPASAAAALDTAPASPSIALVPASRNFPSAKSASQIGSDDAPGNLYRQTFSGYGSPSEGWPEENTWVSFDVMWEENLQNVISNSCASFNASPNNSLQESADLKSAIQSAAKESGVDARYILAVVMQESKGCVRVPTTNNGVNNPGLMQSHNGAHSCASKSPCPSDEITGMIRDGVMGTADGPGLKTLIVEAGGSGVQALYKAARMYNSGSIALSGKLQDGIATHCYVSDIANRLLGWSTGESDCHF